MRKNASNLMDICYQKCEFLVEGMKKNMEVAQMKEKLEYTQTLELAKDDMRVFVRIYRNKFNKLVWNGKKSFLRAWKR